MSIGDSRMALGGSSRVPTTPMLSVIVATYNSASTSWFRQCMESLSNQHYPGPIELVVVDGGSTDSTLSIAEASHARIIHNPMVTELGYSGGKNLALREAKGRLISFVDADNVLMEDSYFARMVRPLTQEEGVVMSVPSPYVPAPHSWPSICRYFCIAERDYWTELSRSGEARDEWTVFRPERAVIPNGGVIRRSALTRIGGWDYDTEVARRLLEDPSSTFAYVPDAHRFHIEMTSYREVWRKFNRRIINQLNHRADKPSVEDELNYARRHPTTYIRNELAEPLANYFRQGEDAYLQSVLVFGIKLSIALSRRAWRKSR